VVYHCLRSTLCVLLAARVQPWRVPGSMLDYPWLRKSSTPSTHRPFLCSPRQTANHFAHSLPQSACRLAGRCSQGAAARAQASC